MFLLVRLRTTHPARVSLNLHLEQGAKVTAHYNTKQDPLQPLLSRYGSERIQALQANLTDENAVENLFREAAGSAFGEVQILVVNHAIATDLDEPVWKMPLERWKHTIDTNLTSSFIVTKEYLKRLENASASVKDYASIIFIGSTAGKYGPFGNRKSPLRTDGLLQVKRGMPTMRRPRAVRLFVDDPSTVAEDHANAVALMYGLTLSLKNEIVKIAPKGRVNSIGPGWVVTVRFPYHCDLRPHKSMLAQPMAEQALKDPARMYQALAT